MIIRALRLRASSIGKRNMATDMQKLIGSSEEDDDEDMGMDIKEEDDDGEDKNNASSMMINADRVIATNDSNHFQQHPQSQEQSSSHGGGTRRSRPVEEKERTKLRERHRRAITARILAGLRKHGNYNLRVRADINDVIAALAREAGWVVLPDGTTFPSRTQGNRPSSSASVQAATSTLNMVPQNPSASLTEFTSGYQSTEEYNACQMAQMKGVFACSSPVFDVSAGSHSQLSSKVGDRGERMENDPFVASPMDNVHNKQVIGIPLKLQQRDFAGTAYVPVYVVLPLGIINMKSELVDPDGLYKQLRILKSVNVDGVVVDCWWGIVEAHAPQDYNWSGYKRLFHIVRELKLKIQVALSFHECGGNFVDDVCIPLPHWVAEIGRSNPNIYFTDKEGRHNPECLSWGIDKERVLRGRTAVEVYFDYMRSFRAEFDEYFEDGNISMIQIGLGPCGELRYPSFPVKHGWRYPGIGEFQCYDQYLMKRLQKAAQARGNSFWVRGPDNAVLSRMKLDFSVMEVIMMATMVLIEHGDRVLSLAKLAFEETSISAKLSGVHWWYKTASHAAELTSGFYNPCNRDGYIAVMSMLKKHGVTLNFTSSEVGMFHQQDEYLDALADQEGLQWQVLNAAWDSSILITSENPLPCHDREGYNKIVENAKPLNNPDGRHLISFAYHRLGPILMDPQNFMEFQRFVKRMHGEAVLDL
ncbi:hypothetical protein V2J09_005180 [Rumex salicifolius]